MGGLEKHGIDTYVSVYKMGEFALSIGDSNNGRWSDGNNISRNWIWQLKKGETVSFKVHEDSYLRATWANPVNFNGELVFVEN